MIANPLQYSEMKTYAEIHHFAPDMEFFVRVISELDDYSLAHFQKKREDDEAKEKDKRDKAGAQAKDGRRMRRQ